MLCYNFLPLVSYFLSFFFFFFSFSFRDFEHERFVRNFLEGDKELEEHFFHVCLNAISRATPLRRCDKIADNRFEAIREIVY